MSLPNCKTTGGITNNGPGIVEPLLERTFPVGPIILNPSQQSSVENAKNTKERMVDALSVRAHDAKFG